MTETKIQTNHRLDAMHSLPHNDEAERGLLGSAMIDPALVMPVLADKLGDGSAFYVPARQTIYQTILRLWLDDPAQKLDFITVTQALREAGKLEAVGGASEVTDLFTFTPTSANAVYYLEIVLEDAMRREVIRVCAAVSAEAYRPGTDVAELRERLQELLIGQAIDAGTGRSWHTAQELALASLEQMEQRYETRGKLRGISSGLSRLDDLTGGWCGGQMIVVAAREKQGKSSLARQLSLLACLANIPTAYFTLEMSGIEIMDALLCTQASVNSKRISDGMISEGDFPRIVSASQEIGNSPLFVCDEADMTDLQFRARARQMVTQLGIKLIVVDYLQLLTAAGNHPKRYEAIVQISRNLKSCAKELDVPILVLSQLNDDGATRDSRTIQMDADKLIVIEHDDQESEDGGKAWLRLKLHRGGPKGSVPVTWRPSVTKFEAYVEVPKDLFKGKR